jgi:type I site-specific restriction endonuclease
MPESEAQARTKIDQALQTSGWSVQPYCDFDCSASRGIALTEVALKIGTADYLLLVEQKHSIVEVECRLSVLGELETVISANLQYTTLHRSRILQEPFGVQVYWV